MGFVIVIWLDLEVKCIKGTMERIVFKILICVQKTMIELLRLERNKWIKMQRDISIKRFYFLFSTIK